MNIVPINPPAIVEMAEERDRKECVSLDRKVDGANRELAKWLCEHETYSSRTVAKWLGCTYSRINYLKRWYKNGCPGKPFDNSNKPDDRERARAQEALESNDNFVDDEFEPSDEVEDPQHVVKHFMDSVGNAKSVAEAYRKIFKVSSFDSEAKKQINSAINQLIVKWRTVQSTLERRGRLNGSEST